MSSSEPRLTTSGKVPTGAEHELTGRYPNPLKSNVPFTTHVLLVGVMLLFFAAATLITLQAAWQWWLIPAAIAIPVITVLAERISRVRKAREARRGMEAELRAERSRASGRGATGTGR